MAQGGLRFEHRSWRALAGQMQRLADAPALRLLRRAPRALPSGGRLLVGEMVLAGGGRGERPAACATCTCWRPPEAGSAPHPSTQRSSNGRDSPSTACAGCRSCRPSSWAWRDEHHRLAGPTFHDTMACRDPGRPADTRPRGPALDALIVPNARGAVRCRGPLPSRRSDPAGILLRGGDPLQRPAAEASPSRAAIASSRRPPSGSASAASRSARRLPAGSEAAVQAARQAIVRSKFRTPRSWVSP